MSSILAVARGASYDITEMAVTSYMFAGGRAIYTLYDDNNL
jgi:hypothetical protein